MAVLHRRIDSSNGTGMLDPLDIAGFCIAGVIALGLAVWALVTLTQQRAKAKMKSMSSDGAFLSVRGVVKESLRSHSEKTLAKGLTPGFQKSIQMRSKGFSRRQIDDSVTLPDKVLQRPLRASHYVSNDMTEYHRRSGMLPRPFSFSLSVTPSRDQARLSANVHESVVNVSSSKSRFSAFSINSSVDSSPTTGIAHKVKRVYDPVLPDELFICVGESLTPVQSFDDGWCLVGRENSSFVATPKCLFRPNTITGDGIELGVVPSWCFIRSAPGLHAERPIRSSSLGITVQLNMDKVAPRDNIISWSNF
ncbi:hypothetical protein C0995_004939 [Termitomyces sp. Mi166|nr:hypothetical protein C0995_004939 [Termitomyces sp. Mi166\